MKKPKINLSGAAIKEFLINNGEKVGLGAAMLVMAVLIVGAIQKKGRSDADSTVALEGKVAMATSVIDNGGSGGGPAVPAAPKYDVRTLVTTVDASKIEAAEAGIPWVHPIKDERKLRGGVTALPVVKPQSFAAHGPFLHKGAVAPAAVPAAPARAAGGPANLLDKAVAQVPPPAAAPAVAGQVAIGRHFVMVTGLIPFAQQQQDFDAKFANAQSPAVDEAAVPNEKRSNPLREVRYRGYTVERREIVNGQPQPAVVMPLGPMFAERGSWAVQLPEIVAEGYTIHTDRGAPITFPLPPLAIWQWDKRAAHESVPLKNEKPAEAAPLPKAEPMKDGDVDPFGGGQPRAADPAAAPGVAQQPAEITHRLFRYWDWIVKPGKTYQYRVQLTLVNPNFKVHERFLENPALAKDELLPTGWSEWAPPATVPLDHQLFLSGVEYVSNQKEAQATVTCVTWDNEKAAEFVKDFKLWRGDIAMFDTEGVAANPVGGGPLTEKNVKYDQRMLLLDFRGGKSSSDVKKHDNAAEAVFWDMHSNQMVVRKQAFDVMEIDAARARNQAKGAEAAVGVGANPMPMPNKDPGALLLPGPSSTTTPAKPKTPPK